MHHAVRLLIAIAFACAGLAVAQSTFDIGLNETRSGTIPTSHVYVLEVPPGLADLTVVVDGGRDDVDLAVYYGFGEELLFEDYSVDPSATFRLQRPRAGRYELHVLNLTGGTVRYDLRVTGTPDATTPTTDEDYYVLDGDVQVGPLSRADVLDRIARGATGAADLVWRPGLDAWVRSDSLPELSDAFRDAVPPPPQPPTPPPLPATPPPAVEPAPPFAELPSVPVDWREVRGGDYCFSVPADWTDETEAVRDDAGEEILSAWVAPGGMDPFGTPSDGVIVLSLLTPAELADLLDDITSDSAARTLREYGAPLAGTDAVWREIEIVGEASIHLAHHAVADHSGRLLTAFGIVWQGATPEMAATVMSAMGSIIRCGEAPAIGRELPAVTELACDTQARSAALSGVAVGASTDVWCPPGCTRDIAVWGTDLYTDDSSVCRAAIHAGVIDAARGGPFVITIHGSHSAYAGSTRHGVTTRSWGSWNRSFTVAPAGTAPGAPPSTREPAPATPVAPPSATTPAAPDTPPLDVRRTPDVVIGLPRHGGELDASRTDGRHTITIDRAGDLRVHVRADGDLTVHAYLLDTDGTTTLHSQTTGFENQRTVERPGLPPGTYHVRVQRTRGEGRYEIETTLTAITTPDDQEPNDRREDAQAIRLDDTTTGRLGYGSPVQGTDTDDWFTITTEHDGDLSVHIDADERLMLHAYLYDIDGSTTLHSQTTGFESERTVERAGLPPGTYYLRLQRTRDHGGYTILPTLTIDTTAIDREPNDNASQAQPIRLGETTSGRLGYGSPVQGTDTDDWFTITTDRAGALSVSIRANPGLSIHAYLYDTNGSTTLHSQTTGFEGQRTVERADLAAGTYYLRIQRTRGHGGYVIDPRFTPAGR